MLNKNNKSFWIERQNFLKKYFGYDRKIDGVPGKYTGVATAKFQADAKARGWYCKTCLIDNDWGVETEKAYKIAKVELPKIKSSSNVKPANPSTNISNSKIKRYSRAEMIKGRKYIIAYVKKNNKHPSNINMLNMVTGKTDNLTKAEYMGLFESENVYWVKHGYKYPNYTTLNSTANNPVVLNYQDNGVNCCPASMEMASMMLFSNVTESMFAKAMNTGNNGTAPNDMINGLKKLGFIAKKIGRNKDAVKKALAEGKAIIKHIQTKNPPAECLGYINDYGHFIEGHKADDNYYYEADPTKGLKTCKHSNIDKATNGRDIYYYSVEVA